MYMPAVGTELKSAAFLVSLKLMARLFTWVPRFKREIDNPETGYVFNARYQFSTRDDTFKAFMVFENGKAKAGRGLIHDPDVSIFYKDKETLARLFGKSPEESLNYLLTNEMSYTGNMAYLTRFTYLSTLLTGFGKKNGNGAGAPMVAPDIDAGEKRRAFQNEILGRKVDRVEVLDDPYLGELALSDFPRLKAMKNRRFAVKPAICIERARLITEFHRKFGFETDPEGNPWDPVLRQGKAVAYALSRKAPVIAPEQLVPGSTTTKEVGVPIYPELIGTLIWPELSTIGKRELNPNNLDPEDARELDMDILPFWTQRNVREVCRKEHGNPLSQQLEERFVLYFMMKNNAISHTIPGFGPVLEKGLGHFHGLAEQKAKRARKPEKINFYKGVAAALEGVRDYANHLADEAERQAGRLISGSPDQARRKEELTEIARICRTVPWEPAETLHEAVTAIWISFVCLHAENANSALSIGRLDQLLQPYFLAEAKAARTKAQREALVKRAIELTGCLFVRFNDHDPLVPDVGNKLFGGSSSDDTVTVGGVDRDGNNAVCDMTYIILKAAEMLCFQDPNMNARYHPGVNSKEYLRRLLEVNVNTVSQPSLHNDKTMIEALIGQGFSLEDARDWGATGCVEPTSCGRHYGHTNCMLLNMVAPLEMALNNGVHPVMGEKIGPETGTPARDFPDFKDFYAAYTAQLEFLIDQSVEINNFLGMAHQKVHPTPLLSAFYEGPLEKGRDLIFGGARYNTSGVALVSVTDAVDSLLAVKKLVYEEKSLDFASLIKALEEDFESPEGRAIHGRIMRVKKFGSDSTEAVELAQRIMDFVSKAYGRHKNYRGGKYLPGYWSISYHVGFGMLSGALPSGRKKGRAFTPGLTPSPDASDNLLDNIRAVAALDNKKMPNNIAFNVKLAPQAGEPHDRTLDLFTSYVKAYFDLGGMQWQTNVVGTETLKDAMANPDDYKWLLVRISGYNAYFTKLNPDMQRELVERAQHS